MLEAIATDQIDVALIKNMRPVLTSKPLYFMGNLQLDLAESCLSNWTKFLGAVEEFLFIYRSKIELCMACMCLACVLFRFECLASRRLIRT